MAPLPTLSGALINIVGSTGTVLLIVRFLSPVEQGYYYTLAQPGLLAGRLRDGLLLCNSAAGRARMRSIWNCSRTECAWRSGGPCAVGLDAAAQRCAGTPWPRLAMGLILAPVGTVFFARHTVGAAHVDWLGPWLSGRGRMHARPMVHPILFVS